MDDKLDEDIISVSKANSLTTTLVLRNVSNRACAVKYASFVSTRRKGIIA